MLKATVIIGNESKKKSIKAIKLAFSRNLRTKYIEGKIFQRTREFFFNECDLDTEMIFINDVENCEDLQNIIFEIKSGVIVHKQSHNPFRIELKEVVIVCKEKVNREQIEGKGISLSRRIELIEL
ncbi:MAG: hypothetical protein K2Y30_01810 [Flavobacteriaceae bacterium]|nr:hypothetical protein [Flavobacteriaceae bacterium]